jgi:hypothetical protein
MQMSEQTELLNQSSPAATDASDTLDSTGPFEGFADRVIAPQVGDGACGCGTTPGSGPAGGVPASYVYAIGQIDARFPSLAAEKEFAQAAGRTDTAGKTDRQALQAVLSEREHRYLMRQMCWVLTIHGLDTYLLVPSDPGDFDLLAEAIRPVHSPNDIDVVIGTRGPIAGPEVCNGLMIPIVAFEQIYSFDRAELIKAIPKPPKTTEAQFAPAAEELFNRIMLITDNAGDTDEHRALNYLSMRYPAIYARAADQFGRDFSLTGVEVRPSPLSSARKIADVIFSYTNRKTDFTEKFSVRVDVTEEFPFLVTKLSPHFDH